MTVLVGVLCSDGVVIGADSIATSSAGMHPIIRMPSDDKIKIVADRIIIAGTGSVGLSQRFHSIVQSHWDGKGFANPANQCVKEMAEKAVKDFQGTGTPRTPQSGFGFGAMVAAPISDKPELVEYGLLDFQPERKTPKLHFVSMGSGQLLADPFLAFVSRVLWAGKQPDVKTAMFGVYWALDHAIKYAPGGVGEPIVVATLQRESGQWRARIAEREALQEQSQHIAEIESRIARYPADIITQAPAAVPPAPPAKP